MLRASYPSALSIGGCVDQSSPELVSDDNCTVDRVHPTPFWSLESGIVGSIALKFR